MNTLNLHVFFPVVNHSLRSEAMRFAGNFRCIIVLTY